MITYDLIVVGAGSGNMLLGPEFDHPRTAIVEADRFGGTCLNRGCIPSKMLVVAADAARAATDASRLGVHATLDRVDWPAIRGRIFDRIDPMHASAVKYRRKSGVDVYTAPARFVAPRVLEVGWERITADQIVVAAGSRPVIPPIPGLDGVEFYTSDTIMRVADIPASVIVIGGGFIAAEMGHVFGAFGADITIAARGPRLLMPEDEQVSTRFTELAQQRFTVLLETEVTAVASTDDGVVVTVERGGQTEELRAEALLVATGRRPNTDLLDVAAGGLEVDEHGHVVADDSYRTSVEGVWAFGDVANHFQLKHMANAEARVVTHNLTHPDALRQLVPTLVPHAVFSEPQVAGVGLTEQQARDGGVDHVIAVQEYADVAYGWALEDTSSFVKLIADPHARTFLGAHIIGPQAATLLQPLLQAMMLGQTVDQLAHDVLYVHPALTEVLEQALLSSEMSTDGSATTCVAGVDVGGTNIEVGLVAADHEVLGRAKAQTPAGGPDAVLDTIQELIKTVGGEPAAVGVGIPGVVHDGEVLTVPNLPNWNGHVDLAPDLGKRLGVPVAMGNDANVGLLGEWLAGAAAGASNVLGVWMGTGIGGALILDGAPFAGAQGATGEIGHVIVTAGGALCGCGRRGCVEAYAGRRSMETTASMMTDAGRETKLWEIRDKLGKTALSSKVWARALSDKDPLATELFSTAISTLAVGIASVVNILDVERVVIGGGMAEKLGQHLADRIGAAAQPWMLQPHPDMTFIAAALGDDSGVVGAAALARELIDRD